MKLLFRSLIIVCIIFFSNSDLFSQPPDDGTLEAVGYSDGAESKGCYTVSFEGVKPYYCVGEPIDISIVLKWDPDCNSLKYCKYSLDFFIDGKDIFLDDTEPTKGNRIYNFNKSLSKGNHKLKIVLKRRCGSFGLEEKINEEVNIIVLEAGDPYIIEEGSVEVPSERDCETFYNDKEYLDKYSVCCGQSGKISTTISIEESSTISNSYTVDIGVGLNLGVYKINNLVNIGESFVIGSSSSTNYSGSFSKSFSYNSNDKCVFPVPKFIVHRIKLVEYIADCDNNLNNDQSTGWLDYIDIPAKKIEYYLCHYDRPTDCEGKPNIFFEYNFDFYRYSGCSGILTASFGSEYNTNGVLFLWISPNGTNYTTKDINFSELGLYTLIVTDKCCTEYEYSVNVCKKTITTDWEVNESTGQYCRTVTCQGDPVSLFRSSDCDGNEYEECVTPVYGEWIFDESDKKCKQDVIINGEIIPYLQKDKEPIIIEEFDESIEQCVKNYYCEENGELEFMESEAPLPHEDDEWGYDGTDDDFDDYNCYRSLYCYDGYEPIEGLLDEVEAEIEWEFDDIFLTCNGTVVCDDSETDYSLEILPVLQNVSYDEYFDECISDEIFCDNIEILGESYSFAPYEVGDWNLYCERITVCLEGGEEFIISGDASYDIDYSDPQGECESGFYAYWVSCDGEEINDFVCAPPGFNSSTTRSSFSIYQDNQNIEICQKTCDSNSSYQFLLFDTNGRLIKVEPFMSSNFQVYSVNLFDYIYISGIYYATILEKGKIVHSQKLSIVK